MASNDLIFDSGARGFDPVAAPAATPDTRNRIPVMDYGAGVDDVARMSIQMPPNYGGNGLHIDLTVMASTAVAGDSDWESAFENGTGQDADSDSFAAAQTTINTVVPGTSGVPQVIRISHTNAQLDGLLANEIGRLEIKRKGTNDTAAGDMELRRVFVTEQ